MTTHFIQSMSGQKVHTASTIELEHLIDHSGSPTLDTKYNKKKSPNVSTRFYLCSQHIRNQSKCKLAMYITMGVLLLAYCIVSYFIDVPYWIVHGYYYHKQHFKWYSSLSGEYCSDHSLAIEDWIYEISQNNTDFVQTRS
eukprot:387598_1